MNYFDKTPNEVALEYELIRCKSELEYLQKRVGTRYSTQLSPETMVMEYPMQTLQLYAEAGIEADWSGCHVFVTTRALPGKHTNLRYYVSANQMNPDPSSILAELHRKLVLDLGSKNFS
jgi:hypothetical protein